VRLPWAPPNLSPLRLPGFRNLFFATLGSSFGTLLAAVALAIDVKDKTSSSPYTGVWVAAVLIVEFLPTIIVGLLLGPLVDRLDRRSLMIAADALRVCVFVALPFAPGAATVVALASPPASSARPSMRACPTSSPMRICRSPTPSCRASRT
jgi:MFS family permease